MNFKVMFRPKIWRASARVATTIGLAFCFFAGSTLFAQNTDSTWNGYPAQSKPNESVAQIPNNTLKNGTAETDEIRFYLLRTGFLTEGLATNDGKQYHLKTNFGTMSVPIANVEFIGQTREDVYSYKKQFVDERNCNELMKFAEWCFNNQLPQQGIAEYQRALAVAPNAILTEVIRKRLEMEQKPKDELIPSSDVPTFSNLTGDTADVGLGHWVNGVPKTILDTFSKKVQPVLISRCASANCHGSNSENELKLSIPNHTLGNTTYRNLRSVMMWVDFDYPSESQLLSTLVTYHGGAKPALSVESNQYHHVVQWVQLTAKELPNEYRNQLIGQKSASPSKEVKGKELVEQLPPALRKAMRTESSGTNSEKSTEMPAAFLPPIPNSNSVQKINGTVPPEYSPTRLNVLNPPSASNLSEEGNQNANKKTNEMTEKEKSDPFDPNLFNARYHGAKNRIK